MQEPGDPGVSQANMLRLSPSALRLLWILFICNVFPLDAEEKQWVVFPSCGVFQMYFLHFRMIFKNQIQVCKYARHVFIFKQTPFTYLIKKLFLLHFNASSFNLLDRFKFLSCEHLFKNLMQNCKKKKDVFFCSSVTCWVVKKVKVFHVW